MTNSMGKRVCKKCQELFADPGIYLGLEPTDSPGDQYCLDCFNQHEAENPE